MNCEKSSPAYFELLINVLISLWKRVDSEGGVKEERINGCQKLNWYKCKNV